MSPPLLEVKGLKKYFPLKRTFFGKELTHVKAVDGIDFTIQEGEVLGLVGESGSGKSTAGRAAIRLIERTAGSIYYEGKDLDQLDQQEFNLFRQEAQIVFQDPYSSLNPRKSIGDSIGEALFYHGKVSNYVERNKRVFKVLSLVGLPKTAINRYPHEFSGGQQQRVCIGRAIAPLPRLVVCDEAVSALDVSVQAQILNLLNDLRNELNLSYLFISHDLSVVRFICDRVLVMHYGKIVESGETDTLFQHPQHSYTQNLLAAVPKMYPSKG